MGFYTQVPMTQEQLDAESLARQREEVELRDGVVVDSVVIPTGTQAESNMLWRAPLALFQARPFTTIRQTCGVGLVRRGDSGCPRSA